MVEGLYSFGLELRARYPRGSIVAVCERPWAINSSLSRPPHSVMMVYEDYKRTLI